MKSMEQIVKLTGDVYHVRSNWCQCHPETCCCDDWTVYSPDGEKHSTYSHRETAEEVAEALNHKPVAMLNLIDKPHITLREAANEIERLQKECSALRSDAERLIDAREVLQEFRRRLYAVPTFGNKVNRATREALTFAHNVILNLDSVGGPLDYPPFNGQPYVKKVAAMKEQTT